MSLGAPYTDVRIARAYLSWDHIEALPGLALIDLHPPAAGPEVELTFGTAEGAEPASEEFIANEVERITRRPVLAVRRRGAEPDPDAGTLRDREVKLYVMFTGMLGAFVTVAGFAVAGPMGALVFIALFLAVMVAVLRP